MEVKTTNFGQTKIIKNKPRLKEDVQKEYAELCGMAGDKQYRKLELEAQLQQINEKLFQLNQEFVRLEAIPENAPTVEETKTP